MVSVNQVKHFFYAKAVPSLEDTPRDILTEGELGDIEAIQTTVNGNPAIRLQYVGHGGLIVSDIIELDKVASAKAIKAADFNKPLAQATLSLDSSINGGAPVAGEDYIVDIQVSNYIALGDTNVLTKFGAVRAYAGMTANELYVRLAKSFALNFKRDEEINKLFTFELTITGEDPIVVKSTDSVSALLTAVEGKTVEGVTIKEVSQEKDWVRGEFPVTRVNFEVFPKTVIVNGDELIPFEVDETSGAVAKTNQTAVLTNVYEIADTEFFCAGERGDQYRQIGYPNTIRTKYLLDDGVVAADKAKGLDVLDIEFYHQGRGTSVQHSDKHILIVADGSDSSSFGDEMTDVISALADAGIHVES